MNVIYTFQEESINPYVHFYEEKVTNLSFINRSRIFVHEYLSNLLKNIYLDWNQLEFYDENNVKLDESFIMIERVNVCIKDPIYTRSYPYDEILKKLDIPNKDFQCLYYWSSECVVSKLFGLNGISRKNGKLKSYYTIIEDKNDLTNLYDNMTKTCKKRVIFFLE